MSQRRVAFSLVELSIVLVILGLLVGGVLAGKSLIRAAELRDVSTSIARYNTSLYAFRDRYFALPGDMTNAASFWPSCTDSANNPCNGDGDRIIPASAGCSSANPRETFRAWQHLQLAGLVEGDYSGANAACSSGSRPAEPGVNVPRLKIPNAGAHFHYNGTAEANTLRIATAYSNSLEGPLLKPEEAWNIDQKMDDGVPTAGKVWGTEDGTPATTATCRTGAGAALYDLSSNEVLCIIVYLYK